VAIPALCGEEQRLESSRLDGSNHRGLSCWNSKERGIVEGSGPTRRRAYGNSLPIPRSKSPVKKFWFFGKNHQAVNVSVRSSNVVSFVSFEPSCNLAQQTSEITIKGGDFDVSVHFRIKKPQVQTQAIPFYVAQNSVFSMCLPTVLKHVYTKSKRRRCREKMGDPRESDRFITG
jgi:hypothetical protein